MKATIKIKRLEKGILLPTILEQGDWIDLRAARNIEVGNEAVTTIPLGVAMKLPDGYEAIVVSRSSTSKKFHIWNAGALGIIDNKFAGNDDQWMYPATMIGAERTTIYKGERICQFRIQLSQKATAWQKIKWLFTSGVRIVEVDGLGDDNRGGFGSSGTI